MIYITQLVIWAVAIGVTVAFYFLYRNVDKRISNLEKEMDDMVGLYLVRGEHPPKTETVYLSKRKRKEKK